jgi:hypothetical protein
MYIADILSAFLNRFKRPTKVPISFRTRSDIHTFHDTALKSARTRAMQPGSGTNATINTAATTPLQILALFFEYPLGERNYRITPIGVDTPLRQCIGNFKRPVFRNNFIMTSWQNTDWFTGINKMENPVEKAVRGGISSLLYNSQRLASA